MSKEWMIRTLVSLGFAETDAQVYSYLATEGPQKARDIADSLAVSKRKVYHVLKKLDSVGIVKASSEYPTRFSALSFEKVLDFLLKEKVKQKQILEECKDELLSTWQKMTKNSKK